mmetsp:Transcript_26176/g.62474  ORF Transcript_26176/g.62474 Transcript_26176/m.62474 type:complete len:221 (+) Transcript_26176:424-1086(+)
MSMDMSCRPSIFMPPSRQRVMPSRLRTVCPSRSRYPPSQFAGGVVSSFHPPECATTTSPPGRTKPSGPARRARHPAGSCTLSRTLLTRTASKAAPVSETGSAAGSPALKETRRRSTWLLHDAISSVLTEPSSWRMYFLCPLIFISSAAAMNAWQSTPTTSAKCAASANEDPPTVHPISSTRPALTPSFSQASTRSLARRVGKPSAFIGPWSKGHTSERPP